MYYLPRVYAFRDLILRTIAIKFGFPGYRDKTI